MVLTSSCSLMTILLILLRSAGAISWSWWWVVAPLWLPLGVTGFAFAGLALFARVERSKT
jgi:hypothetical protein